MDTQGASAWRMIFIVAAVLLVIAMVVSGQIMFAGVILVFLLVLAVGGLMYRRMGPPPTS